MYKCEKCRAIFSEDEAVRREERAVGYVYAVCPRCGSDFIEECDEDELEDEEINE